MKKLMKLMTALLALALAVSMTGCGRTEENKSADILHPLTAGANRDPETMLSEMTAVYEVYTTATEGDEIIAAAQEFNRLYDEYMELAEKEDRVGQAKDKILRALGRRYRIKEGIYRGKAALADRNMDADCEDIFFYCHPKTGDSKFVFVKYDEAGRKQIQVLKQDGSVYSPDLSKILAMDPSLYNPSAPTQDSLIVEVVANADWMKFEFPLDDPTATGEEIPFDQPQTEYMCWHLWEMDLTEFNTVEARETRGEMFEK